MIGKKVLLRFELEEEASHGWEEKRRWQMEITFEM